MTFTGHAFEARINAEDPADGFAPQIGTVSHLVGPDWVRWDSAVVEGNQITSFYDPMIAKLVVDGVDRSTARRRLARALDQLIIGGLTTNTGFHRWLIDQPPIVEGRVTTRFLDETELPGAPPPAIAEAAEAWRRAHVDARSSDAWQAMGSFRITPHQPSLPIGLRSLDGELHESQGLDATAPLPPASVSLERRSLAINVDGHTHTFSVPTRSERWAPAGSEGHGHASAVVAPFPGAVTEVPVVPGQHVAGGDPVVVIEAMKMLHTLTAAGPGTVDEVRVSAGEQVASNQVLVTFEIIHETHVETDPAEVLE